MTDQALSITEIPNELTSNIDVASPLGIVRLLRQSDGQIYNGYSEFAAISDREMLERFEACVQLAADALKCPQESCIVLAGAGTSGRLAMFISRAFNKVLPESARIFRYLIAGGNLALIKAQEGAEDDPNRAVEDLESIVGNAKRVLYIGITCGMSAPYIAGQIAWCISKPHARSVLLGFNTLDRSRNHAVEGWDRTFRQVAMEAECSPNCVVLNPIVGPEPITGSTRMKGGSATKMLLEVLFVEAARRAGLVASDAGEDNALLQQLARFDNVRREFYRQADPLSELVRLGGETLRSRDKEAYGHLYYLGEETAGMLGLVDASECPPTFGAHFGDVRGFVAGGWKTLLGSGVDLSDQGEWYRIDLDEFESNLLPKAGASDLVVALGIERIGKPVRDLLEASHKRGTKTAAILVNPKESLPSWLDAVVTPDIGCIGPVDGIPIYAEYAMKLAINALTTGGHVLAGKVFGNRMIDLRISNNKLFFRTLGIVSTLMGVSEDVARESILKAIYETDAPTDQMRTAPISEYVNSATPREKVVPIALLLATGEFSYSQATEALHQDPIVRNLVGKYARWKSM